MEFSSLSVLEDHLLFVTGGWGGSEDFLEENHMVFKENGAGSVASERVLRMDYRQGGSLECHKALGGIMWILLKHDQNPSNSPSLPQRWIKAGSLVHKHIYNKTSQDDW